MSEELNKTVEKTDNRRLVIIATSAFAFIAVIILIVVVSFNIGGNRFNSLQEMYDYLDKGSWVLETSNEKLLRFKDTEGEIIDNVSHICYGTTLNCNYKKGQFNISDKKFKILDNGNIKADDGSIYIKTGYNKDIESGYYSLLPQDLSAEINGGKAIIKGVIKNSGNYTYKKDLKLQVKGNNGKKHIFDLIADSDIKQGDDVPFEYIFPDAASANGGTVNVTLIEYSSTGETSQPKAASTPEPFPEQAVTPTPTSVPTIAPTSTPKSASHQNSGTSTSSYSSIYDGKITKSTKLPDGYPGFIEIVSYCEVDMPDLIGYDASISLDESYTNVVKTDLRYKLDTSRLKLKTDGSYHSAVLILEFTDNTYENYHYAAVEIDGVKLK